jgi:proton-dependent oligopeptide transporter, POT family
VWFLSSMLAGPVAGWIGGLTQAHGHAQYSMLHSLQVYTHVFGIIGVVVLAVSIVMWLSRPWLNRVIAH